MHFIVGIIITLVGYSLVAKTEAYLSNFGRIEFFERKLGVEGGSRLGYKLIGLLGIFIGVMVFFNMWGGIMSWLLGPILRLGQQG